MTYLEYRERVEFGAEEYAVDRRALPEPRDRMVRVATGTKSRCSSSRSSTLPAYKIASGR